MSPNRIILEFPDGSIKFVDEPDVIRAIGLTLPKNITWQVGATEVALRKKYFQMVTELAKSQVTGYTKVDLHEALKPLLLSKFRDFPQFFKTGIPEYSTRHLTREGWIAVIEQLKSISVDVFGYIYKQ